MTKKSVFACPLDFYFNMLCAPSVCRFQHPQSTPGWCWKKPRGPDTRPRESRRPTSVRPDTRPPCFGCHKTCLMRHTDTGQQIVVCLLIVLDSEPCEYAVCTSPEQTRSTRRCSHIRKSCLLRNDQQFLNLQS